VEDGGAALPSQQILTARQDELAAEKPAEQQEAAPASAAKQEVSPAQLRMRGSDCTQVCRFVRDELARTCVDARVCFNTLVATSHSRPC
jgi:hypothetical protein